MMKITQLLIFTTTAVVLHSMSSSGTVDAWWSSSGSISSGIIGIGCSKSDCHHSEKCHDGLCVSACHEKDCDGDHEACLVRHHKAKCVCKSGYGKKNESGTCEKEACRSQKDCVGIYICDLVDGIHKCTCPSGTKDLEKGFCSIPCTETKNCALYGSEADCDTAGTTHCKCKDTATFDPETKKCKTK